MFEEERFYGSTMYFQVLIGLGSLAEAKIGFRVIYFRTLYTCTCTKCT
jgi:hypothetical protein